MFKQALKSSLFITLNNFIISFIFVASIKREAENIHVLAFLIYFVSLPTIYFYNSIFLACIYEFSVLFQLKYNKTISCRMTFYLFFFFMFICFYGIVAFLFSYFLKIDSISVLFLTPISLYLPFEKILQGSIFNKILGFFLATLTIALQAPLHYPRFKRWYDAELAKQTKLSKPSPP